MRPLALAITASGMATGLGGSVQACAAAWAGLSRRRSVPFEVYDAEDRKPVPILGHPLGPLGVGFSDVGLLVRLMGLALRDLCQNATLEPNDLADTALILNLPSPYYLARAEEHARATGGTPDDGSVPATTRYADMRRLCEEHLVSRAFRAAGLVGGPIMSEFHFLDQTGFAVTVSRAMALLSERRVARCLIGGVDSLLDARWLRALNALHLLKTPLRPVGLIPGEAAAFLLVEDARGLPASVVRGTVKACATASDSTHRFSETPPTGRVMADVMRQAAQDDSQRRPSLVMDLNGDVPRGNEYGFVCQRLQDLASEVPLVPAVAFGDTRAASGFVGASMVLHRMWRRRERREYMVCSSADSGARAAVLLGP